MKIEVKPIETLKLEFEDGVTHNCKFSAYAMMVLDEEFEGFQEVFKQSQDKPFKAGAKLLYAGMKSCNEDVDIEYSRRVISHLSIQNIIQLFDFAKNTLQMETEDINPKKKIKQPQSHKKKRR